jgi:hypothetical protein
MSERFLRQALLPEVGEGGQARLARATAEVAGPGLAHEVACLYAIGAGFSRVGPGPVYIDALAPRELVTNDPAREVLAGARAALRAMQKALLLEEAGS